MLGLKKREFFEVQAPEERQNVKWTFPLLLIAHLRLQLNNSAMLQTALDPKRLLRFAAVIGVTAVLWLGFGHVTAYAASFTYPHYDVDINVNKDSTVDVTETLTYRFIGLFHGVVRDITLDNPALSQYCVQTGQTCGGFERLSLQAIYDGDSYIDPSEYSVGTVTNKDDNTTYFEIKWTVWPQGQVFDGTQDFVWVIKYRLYGSLGFFGAAPNQTAYVYWNALPSTRGGDVSASKITLTLPPGTAASDSSDILQVYSDNNLSYDTKLSGNSVAITTSDLGADGNVTLAYKLPAGSVQPPANMTYSGWLPWFGTGLTIDGVALGDVGGALHSFPAGKHTVDFSFAGYQTKELQVNVDTCR